MNCTFCDKILIDNNGFFKCYHNNVDVTYLCHGKLNNYSIWYTTFVISEKQIQWQITLSHRDNTTILIKRLESNSHDPKIILKLNHIPKINPTNANHWLDKLLNLKAFS